MDHDSPIAESSHVQQPDRGPHLARLGISLPEPIDGAFWMQVYDGILRRGQTLPVELVTLSSGRFASPELQQAQIDEIVAQELDVLVGWKQPEIHAYRLLDSGLAIVHLSETTIAHPLSVSPSGLGAAAAEVTRLLAQHLGGQGRILVVGGSMQLGFPDDGKSRLAEIDKVLAAYPAIRWRHVASHWEVDHATPQLVDALAGETEPFDGIIGLSDPLALLARTIAREMGRCREDVPVVGINGDSIAVAAILNGTMLATIETTANQLGARAAELACNLAFGQVCEPHYAYQTRLITATTAAAVAAERLSAFDQLLTIPSTALERERIEHLAYLESSLDVSRRLSSVQDERDLFALLDSLIRDAYGFDRLDLVIWDEASQAFQLIDRALRSPAQPPSFEATAIYRDAYASNRLILIPDQRNSLRYEPDSHRADMCTRVVLPMRGNSHTQCLLDLSASQVVSCTRAQVLGLQALADQFGSALHHIGFLHGAPPAATPSPAPAASSTPRTSALTERAVAFIHQHYSEPITRGDLATELCVSENYLTDLFHREMGMSLWTYLNRYRVKQAEALLVGTDRKITEIAWRAGFDDPAYFSRVFRRYTGHSPRAFRKSPQYAESAGD